MSEQEFLLYIKTNQKIIFKLVHLYAVSEEDKKDLYQEILLQAWKNFPAFRGDAKFSTWLYRISLNTIFTMHRRKKPVHYTDTSVFENQLVTHSTTDEAERLYKAIRTLADSDRAVISLHLDGYDNKEIAEMTGITANNVAVRLYRIKQQIANLLKN